MGIVKSTVKLPFTILKYATYPIRHPVQTLLVGGLIWYGAGYLAKDTEMQVPVEEAKQGIENIVKPQLKKAADSLSSRLDAGVNVSIDGKQYTIKNEYRPDNQGPQSK